LTIEAKCVPFMNRVLELIAADLVPGGTRHNARTHGEFTDFSADVPAAVRLGLSDAQTSGGLLISVAPDSTEKLVGELQRRDTVAAVIGAVSSGSGIAVV
jgi:selenide,water dikinase